MTPAENRVRHWQEEVARDPGSDAFVPLADLYTSQGRLDIARRVCSRGLQRHPDHVDGHYLLGRIHRDEGDVQRAYDEWDIALALDPGHAAARRAIGFLCLERGETAEAERHLRRALEADPDDPRLRRALEHIGRGPGHVPVGSGYWQAAAPVIERGVVNFARESRVRLVMVTDLTGRVLAQLGFTRGIELAGFASLAAGVHAAAGEIARMLGQKRFSQLYQGRGEHQLFVGVLEVPAGELLLLAVFGADTTIGLVRALYAQLQAELAVADWPEPPSATLAEELDAALADGLRRALSAGRELPGRR